MSQVDRNDGKLHELHFGLLPHPPYSPDLAPKDYWLFADLKRNIQEKISDIEAYFEAKENCSTKRNLSGAIAPAKSGPGGDGNEGVIRFPKAPALLEPNHQIV